jgi:phosphoglycerate dehydrogenase-like enzyme
MKVLFRYDWGARLQAEIGRSSPPGLEVAAASEADDRRYLDLLADAEVLWHVLRPVSAEHIAAAPRLLLIQKIGVGVNTIALEAARARGIAVCNMPETNSRAVAEMTLLLMLAALRCIVPLDAATRRADWVAGPRLQEGYGEIGGRTVGLVGYGAVPRILAPVLSALGARVLYTARAPREDARGEWRSLDDLLGEADIVSLHVPLAPETEQLIGAAAFARMKRGAILVNTARGGLVDEAALVAALSSGRLAAAGLDVFADEPVRADNPLLALDNVVLAPHIAWLTPETWARSLGVAFENCRRLREGAPLLHRVV